MEIMENERTDWYAVKIWHCVWALEQTCETFTQARHDWEELTRNDYCYCYTDIHCIESSSK